MSKKRFLIIILSLIMMIFCFSPGIYLSAASVYSDVLDDLKKDEKFDISNYPSMTKADFDFVNNDEIIENDVQYSTIITIAESDTNELFIYVYKPLISVYDLKCLKVSMSNEKRQGYEANGLIIYDLELLSTNGVFEKYKLIDYQISSEVERYYNFVSLYREFNSTLDEEKDNFVIDAKADVVAQQYVFYKINGEYSCEVQKFKTLEIDILVDDELLFTNGITIGIILGMQNKAGKLHYLAFNLVDYVAEAIIDADIRIVRKTIASYFELGLLYDGSPYKVEDISETEEYIYLSKTDEPEIFDGKGLLSYDYKWNKILSSDQFIEQMEAQSIEFDSTIKSNLEKSSWVFSYFLSEITVTNEVIYLKKTEDVIEEKGILRIHFIDPNGEHFNLGVVGDLTTSDNEFGGIGNSIKSSIDALKKTFDTGFSKLFLILGIILLLLVLYFVKPLFSLIGSVLVAVIKLPFKLIKSIFSNKNSKK